MGAVGAKSSGKSVKRFLRRCNHSNWLRRFLLSSAHVFQLFPDDLPNQLVPCLTDALAKLPISQRRRANILSAVVAMDNLHHITLLQARGALNCGPRDYLRRFLPVISFGWPWRTTAPGQDTNVLHKFHP